MRVVEGCEGLEQYRARALWSVLNSLLLVLGVAEAHVIGARSRPRPKRGGTLERVRRREGSSRRRGRREQRKVAGGRDSRFYAVVRVYWRQGPPARGHVTLDAGQLPWL